MTAFLDKQQYKTVHVVQGEFSASSDENIMLTTVLGSCIATCMYDPFACVGGMNHFLLPGDQSANSDGVVYGVHAMELLINALLRSGARKERLQAKIFGGARMLNNLSDIGRMNTVFARDFLAKEKIECVGESVGGERARRIRFWPTDGRARQLFMGEATKIVETPVKPAPLAPASDDIELF